MLNYLCRTEALCSPQRSNVQEVFTSKTAGADSELSAICVSCSDRSRQLLEGNWQAPCASSGDIVSDWSRLLNSGTRKAFGVGLFVEAVEALSNKMMDAISVVKLLDKFAIDVPHF